MLRTIKTYNNEAEAHIALSVLKTYSIKGFIFNAYSTTIYPIFFGGVELRVEESDFEKATEILG